MPELPEVETVVRALAPNLTGRSIKGVEIFSSVSVRGSPRRLELLAGRRIERLWRRGKFIRADLSGDLGLAIHLRMTGWLGVLRRRDLAARPAHHARVLFTLAGPAGADEEVLLFRDIRKFGRIWCGRREELSALRPLAKLGPEPLDISAPDFAARLRARRGRLKSLLLDQTFLAGLGNIYADESLFAARLHPLADGCGIRAERAAGLHRAIQAVLRKALAAGGTSIDNYLHPDGTPGWFQRALKVYGREGEPCKACRAPIRRIVVGQRGTWFCGKCQKRR